MQASPLIPIILVLLFTSTEAIADKKADALYEQAIRMHGSAPIEQVFDLYARAAENGNAAAQYTIAMMYSNGEAVNVDYQQAVYWFRKSSDQNFAPAKYRLGELYYFGMGGLEQNTTMAAGLFKHGAELGDADAQMNYAMILATGAGRPVDKETALYWMAQAREGGHEGARQYAELLNASESEGLGAQLGQQYWEQQKSYWVEMAAAFGVREAEEVVDESNGPDETGKR